MKKIVAMALAVVMALGLWAPALAAECPFTDVPVNHWAYEDIGAVAEAGLMNGIGNGNFSPEMRVSVAQFVTLVGRVVFPEITVGDEDVWYGPYVSAAQEAGLFNGTLVDANDMTAEISRYDMAVILRAAGKRMGLRETLAQSSEVTDYWMIPEIYTDAVLAMYGMGLIRGDQNGNFIGGNTMMRAEVATVIMRLKRAAEGPAPSEAQEERTGAEAETGEETENAPSVDPAPME